MQSVSYTNGVMDTFVGGTDARLTPQEVRRCASMLNAACIRRLMRGAAQAHESGYTQYDAEDQAVRAPCVRSPTAAC